ncbi:MAG TPA: AMP-binding protein [Bauldia sp.]|nr:AMP-binding protein [Bauldia sp.]
MRVEDFLKQSAGRAPAAIALAAGKRRRLTYAEFLRLADRAGGSFRAHGITAQDRVVVYMDDTLEAMIALFAIWMVGGVVVRADPRTSGGELAAVLAAAGATGLVTEARLARNAAQAMCGAPELKLLVLAGGTPGTRGETCLAFEDAIRGPALASNSDKQFDDQVIAIEAVGAEGVTLAVSHRDAVAAVIESASLSGGGVLDPRLADALATIRKGATLVVAESSGHGFAFAARSHRTDEVRDFRVA